MLATNLVINEIGGGDSDVLSTRVRYLTSEPYSGSPITPDWLEIHNPTAVSVSLSGYNLTDSVNDEFQWTFPMGTAIAANGYMTLFASGENLLSTNFDESGRLHTNFRLSNNGEYLAITDPDGVVVHEYAPQYDELHEGYTVGLDASDNQVYFGNPTPDAVNDVSSIVAGFVADTKFSIDRGFFDSDFVTTITTATQGATIAYTTDGSEPSPTHGTQVSAPNGITVPAADVVISTTTNLRAMAYFSGLVATQIDTQSYLFLNDVITQASSPTGFPSSWNGVSPDYGMDPDIVNDSAFTQDLLDGFREIPTLSLAADVADIFGSSGIYANPQLDLDIITSAELILGDGSTGFQVDAELKIQGGASRIPSRSPKHALSLRFRDAIDVGMLNYDFYPGSPVTSFDSIQLRARYNNSWIHSNSTQRSNATYIRDMWVRETLLDMGNIDAGRSQPVHLYLNGLYWGLYDIEERPVAAHYAAYFGGAKDDYDAINGGSAVDGNTSSYNAMKSTVNSGNWAAIQQVLDVDNYIDWTIMQWYGGNQDLKNDGNWRAAGGGPDNAPWRFYAWDVERVLEDVNEDRLIPVEDPIGILNSLDNLAEFRLRFADRIQKHLFHDGALTPARNQARWQARIDELQNAVVAESARWGDYRVSNNPYDRGDWTAENNRILNSYFPARTSNAFALLKDDLGLYPSISAASLIIDGNPQHGGEIGLNAQLTLSGGTNIYYTLDGSDPRQEGGAIVGSLYRPGVDPSITLSQSSTVKARVLDNTTWSALTEANYIIIPIADTVTVTEINYHPYDPTAAETAAIPGLAADDFEFIELTNTDLVASVNLLEMKIDDGVSYVLPDYTLPPNGRAVVVRNLAAFQLRYGMSVPVIGQWTSGGLSNSGERLALLDGADNLMFEVDYRDGDHWPEAADGVGATLVRAGDVFGTLGPADKHYGWVAGPEIGGTPGAFSLPRIGVVVNEVRTNSPGGDAIELFNASSSNVNIGGWFLSDSKDNLLKFEIPVGTVLLAGDYFVFDESDFNPNPTAPGLNDFGLNGSAGDDVWLSQPDGLGGVSAIQDDIHFEAAFAGQNLGRIPNGSGRIATLSRTSLGCENGLAHVSDVVITEIQYAPTAPSPAALGIDPSISTGDLEFVEIMNQSDTVIDLMDWQLRGGVDLDFPGSPTLSPGETMLLLSFDPIAAPLRFAAFLVHYSATSQKAIGGYVGQLSDSGEPVRMERPGPPAVGSPTFVPHVVVDEVLYDDRAPWDAGADGGGNSLQRLSTIANGNLSTNWWALVPPNPGSFVVVPPTGDFNRNGVVDGEDVDVIYDAIGSGQSFAALDLNDDDVVDFLDVEHLVRTIIGTRMGDADLDGDVDEDDFALWNANRFDACSHSWSRGDFNGDGFADVSDFDIWSKNRDA